MRRSDGGLRGRGFRAGGEEEEGIGVAAVERNRIWSHPSLEGLSAEAEYIRRPVNGGLTSVREGEGKDKGGDAGRIYRGRKKEGGRERGKSQTVGYGFVAPSSHLSAARWIIDFAAPIYGASPAPRQTELVADG